MRLDRAIFVLGLSVYLARGGPQLHADRIDTAVQEQMRVSQVPGAAVAVIDQGRVVKLAAYGKANLEWDIPVGVDTRFQLASATKIFTGVLLMRLVEKGRVDLDAPVTRWFPEAPRTWAEIKVRQLANHTSGLPDDLGTPAPATVEAIVAAAEARPLAYKPGTESRYGFTDFTVLRAILEKASGQPLPELLQAEIAGPLGMHFTGFARATDDGAVRQGDVLPHRASTYGLREGRIVTSDFFFAPQGYGAGGLYSSAEDLAKLFVALDGGRFLKPESLRALETPAELPGGKRGGFGVGWVARTHCGLPVVGHSGGPALADILRVEDRKLTVVVLTNQQVFYPLLGEAVADTLLPPCPAPEAITDARPSIAANLKAVMEAAVSRTPGALQAAPATEGASAPLQSPFGHALLVGVGPLQDVELLGETQDGERRYRLRFARKTMVWVVHVDSRDTLTALRPEQ